MRLYTQTNMSVFVTHDRVTAAVETMRRVALESRFVVQQFNVWKHNRGKYPNFRCNKEFLKRRQSAVTVNMYHPLFYSDTCCLNRHTFPRDTELIWLSRAAPPQPPLVFLSLLSAASPSSSSPPSLYSVP